MSATFSVIDTETTGFSPNKGDRVLEIAVVSLDERGDVLDRWVSRVNPERRVGATHIHGITQAQADRAPRFADVAEEARRRMAGTLIVAHNAPFDMRFLVAEFGRVGIDISRSPSYCTMKGSRAAYPGLPTHRLDAVCSWLGIDLVNEHSALGDTNATVEVFRSLLATPGHFATRDIPSLVDQARRYASAWGPATRLF